MDNYIGKIKITVFFETKLKHKLENYLDVYKFEVNYMFHDLKISKSVTSNNQFEATFYIDTDGNDIKSIVFQILTLSSKLWSTSYYNWIFHGPYISDYLTFETILFNECDDQELKRAKIEFIDNFRNDV